jgi:hypothetical protein
MKVSKIEIKLKIMTGGDKVCSSILIKLFTINSRKHSFYIFLARVIPAILLLMLENIPAPPPFFVKHI